MKLPVKSLLLLFSLTIALLSCKKTTVISGVVMDSGTGEPLEGAQVYVVALKSSNTNTWDVEDKVDFITGMDGKFDIEVEGKKIGYVGVAFNKAGYGENQGIEVENGTTTKDIVKYLHPFDAVLRLKLVNKSGASELHYYYSGQLYENRRFSGPGGSPEEIPLGDSVVYYIKVLGGSMNRVVWATQKFLGTNIQPNTYQFYCPRRDTTAVEIEF